MGVTITKAVPDSVSITSRVRIFSLSRGQHAGPPGPGPASLRVPLPRRLIPGEDPARSSRANGRSLSQSDAFLREFAGPAAREARRAVRVHAAGVTRDSDEVSRRDQGMPGESDAPL